MCGEVVKRLKFTAFFTDSHAMSSALSIASSGMQAAQLRLGQSAHNVANLETPGFRRLGVEQQALPDGQGVQAQTRQARQIGHELAWRRCWHKLAGNGGSMGAAVAGLSCAIAHPCASLGD